MQRWTWSVVGLVLSGVLVACGQQPAASTADTTGTASASAASGMDHGALASTAASDMAMASGAASAIDMAPAADSAAASASEGADMDHGAMRSPDANAPYDARFLDSMIEHHQGAITMAEQALDESDRQEIRALSQTIIDTQQQEVDQMEQWRTDWYADLPPTGGMGMEMGAMAVPSDAGLPFDQRFLTAMIAHHRGAIEMATDAQQNAEHAEIKALAQTIIAAQEAEITQMQQWMEDWFGQ